MISVVSDMINPKSYCENGNKSKCLTDEENKSNANVQIQ